MKKENRLKLNKDFRRLYGRGKSSVFGCIVVYCMKNRYGKTRVGLTVSKNVGNAVVRNRAKRLMRVAFDNAFVNLNPGYDMVIVARNRIVGKKSQKVSYDMLSAMRKLNMIKNEKDNT